MSRIFLLIVVVWSILQAGPVPAQIGTDRTAVQNQVVESEKAIIDAILKNDPKTFHSYVLPDSYVMGGDGVIEAADVDKLMEEMKADCKLAKWELAESMVYWVNDSTVVHLFQNDDRGDLSGSTYPGELGIHGLDEQRRQVAGCIPSRISGDAARCAKEVIDGRRKSERIFLALPSISREWVRNREVGERGFVGSAEPCTIVRFQRSAPSELAQN
jgi:hypothetical protein